MSATTDTRELAAALRVSARAVRKRSSAERWPAQTTAGAKVYVLEEMPEECTRAVLRLRSEKAKAAAIQAATSQRSVEVSRKWREFEAAPAWRRERATERALFLDVVQRFRAAGHPVNAAIFKASELQAKAPSRSACMRWLADVKGLAREHWPAFLMPDPAPGNRRAFVHPDALVWLVDDYCRAERPTAEMCFERLRRIAKEQRPEWLPLPSDRRLLERLRDIDRDLVTFTREGPEAAERLGPLVKRSVEHMDVMDEWNADGHRFDVHVMLPSGKVGRVVLLTWQDIASRMIVSWRIGESETADLACLSMADAVRAWGLPGAVRLDNGRAFASRSLSGGAVNRHRWNDPARDWNGMLAQLGVAVHFVKPYSGKSKPIERAFADLRNRVTADDRCKGACTGNDPLNKPHNYGSAAVPFEVFKEVVREAIDDHNQKTGRTGGICNGRSFAQTHLELYGQAKVRMATEAQLRLLLLDSRPLKVSKDGRVKLFGNEYWAPELSRLIGEQVVARFDPDAMQSGVHIYRPDGSYVVAKMHGDRRRALKAAERTLRDQATALDIKPRSLLDHVPPIKPKPGAVVPLAMEQRRRQPAEQQAQSATVLDHPTIAEPKRRTHQGKIA